MTDFSLREIQSRHQMIRYFDGYAAERVEDLDERKLKRPLVKTQLMEILDGERTRTLEGLASLFTSSGVKLQPIDDALLMVSDSEAGEIGFMERLGSRVVAIYSTRSLAEKPCF